MLNEFTNNNNYLINIFKNNAQIPKINTYLIYFNDSWWNNMYFNR